MALSNPNTQEYVRFNDIRQDCANKYYCTPCWYQVEADRLYEKETGRTPEYKRFETRNAVGESASGEQVVRLYEVDPTVLGQCIAETGDRDSGVAKALYITAKATAEFSSYTDAL